MGLVLMWTLFVADYTPRQWLIIVAGSIATIDAGFLLLNPELVWYVGLSG